MFTISAVLGAKYYPIPYRWGRLAAIILTMGAVYGASLLIDAHVFADVVLGQSPTGLVVAKLGVHTVLILGYIAVSWIIIRK